MGKCGDDCNGLYFTGNFAAGGAQGKAKTFVENYKKAYNKAPDEVAALTYDAVKLIGQSLKNTGGLTGNLIQDRTKLRNQIAAAKNLEGVTGMLSYHGNGDPSKCAVVIKIDETGQFTSYDTVCP
jgi:branched-chain amino acid transport system substrate-binding protein